MVRIFSLSIAGAALALSSAAFAGQDALEDQALDTETASVDAVAAEPAGQEVVATENVEAAAKKAGTKEAPVSGPQPVKLIEFDGEYEVLKTSQRLRIWRSHLTYNLTVGPDGKTTACELTDGFRRTYVKQKLCTVLVKHHTFEPARDASDEPVEGVYSARLSYLEMRKNN